MIEKQIKLKSDLILKNPFWEYYTDEYSLNGFTYKYYYVHSKGSVFIIPKLEEDLFVLTKQFRYLNQKESIEFPGGGKKEINTDLQNALNELKEETGYIPDKIEEIGNFNPFNGVTDEICQVFLAENLTKMEQNLDETEQIEVLLLNSKQINKMISTNEIWDGMTLAAWAIFNNSKEQL